MGVQLDKRPGKQELREKGYVASAYLSSCLTVFPSLRGNYGFAERWG